jgi:SAM-dependent methyltransferase
MSSLVERLDRSLYPGQGRHWDDALLRQSILRHLLPESVVLDLGAGAGIVEQMLFKGRAARVCGIDLDPRVVDNPNLDEGRVADAGRIPYGDGEFDLVYADNLLEHLLHPLPVFREVARVLRRGGLFLFKTPNRNHYMPLIARVTPHRFHRYVNRKRGRAEVDTFPTHYRANTALELARLAAASGLVIERLGRVEGRPEYLRLAWPAYVVGALYERLVNSSEVFAAFRVVLLGELRKPH